MKKLLIIDDESSICSSLTFALEDKYKVESTTNPYEGLEILKAERKDLVLLDLKIGDVDGLEILQKITEIDKNISVIMMTAYGSIVSSVEAIKKGAYTYLTKPLNLEELYIVISQALEFKEMNEKIKYLNNELQEKYQYNGIIGKTDKMKSIFDYVEKIKDVDIGVIITGESGTGKELIARAIHFSGKRCEGKFVEINCAAIPEGLLEEEFFGHKKGSFTNAVANKIGRFQYADGGTIFLDEIGDMSLNLQAKLLRVLEDKRFTPLGSNESIETNIRIIAATNKNLKEMINEGSFRKDLYFRLNRLEINLPPLRERKQDLPLLFNHFIEKYNKELDRDIKKLSKDVENILIKYDYPGNVRELANILECGVLLSQGSEIDLESLPFNLKEETQVKKSSENDLETERLEGLSLKEIEKIIIKRVLEKNKGNKKQSADSLGISERGLRNKLNEYELEEGRG